MRRLAFSNVLAFVQMGVSILLCMTLSSCISCTSDDSSHLIQSTNVVQQEGQDCLQSLLLNLDASSDLGYFSLQTMSQSADEDYGGVLLMEVMFDEVTSFTDDEIVIRSHIDESLLTDEQRQKYDSSKPCIVHITTNTDAKRLVVRVSYVPAGFEDQYQDMPITFEPDLTKHAFKRILLQARRATTEKLVNNGTWLEPVQYLGLWSNKLQLAMIVYAVFFMLMAILTRTWQMIMLHILACITIWLTLHWSWMPGFALLPVFFIVYPLCYFPNVSGTFILSSVLIAAFAMLCFGLYKVWTLDGFWATIGYGIVWGLVAYAGFAVIITLMPSVKCDKCGRFFNTKYAAFCTTERFKNIKAHYSLPLNSDGTENRTMQGGELTTNSIASTACYHCRHNLK